MAQPAGTPRQFALDFAHRPAQTRDDLMVSDANREAVAAIDRWPDWPSPILIVTGPEGSGKSHLAALWRERAGALALDPRDLGQAPLADLPNVAINDADRVGLDQTGLFHLLNAAREAKRQVLLTARLPAADWNVSLPDLVSRLKLAAVALLREPDDALLAAVMTKLFADRQVEVEARVVQFLLRRMERSLAATAVLVDRLDRLAIEQRAPVTRALASALLASMEAERG